MPSPHTPFLLDSVLRTPLPSGISSVSPTPEQKILLLPEQIQELLRAAEGGESSVTLSTDVNLTTEQVSIKNERHEIQFEDGTLCSLEKIPKLKDRTFYHVEDHQLRPFHFFCEETNKVYKLLPTRDIPSFSISSAPMHQITRSTPADDTKAKVSLLQPIRDTDMALDTCFGLGYSAGMLAQHAKQVVTCEFDPNSLKVASVNPHSRAALSATNMTILQGDIFELIKSFKDNAFNVVLHDPPTPKIAPLLYSSEFYQEVKRVLVKGGKLFHYTPRPNIQKKQRDFPGEIKKRLGQNGFKNLKMSDAAQGLLAVNP
jgi:predicted methyltransferase